jgi:DNA modification methylase
MPAVSVPAVPMARAIVLWPLSRLQPYERNPRTHSAEQIAKIADSISEFGFTNPILVDGAAGIIAGHGRLEAARRLGLEQVPVIELTHLSEEQKRAYIIADNRLALDAGWDEDLLREELEALRTGGFELGLTGFGDEELAALLEAEPEGSEEEDAVPELLEEPISHVGDLWLLGRHRLLCGDALDPVQVDVLLAGTRARMVFTDPPWNVAIGSNRPPETRRAGIANDDLPQAEFEVFLQRAAASIARVVTGDVFVVMSSSQWPTVDAALRAAGLHWSGTLVWVKDAFVLGRSNFHRRFEPIWYGWRQDGKSSFRGRRDLDDVWEIPRPRASEEHPTMKPVALVRKAIESSSLRGDSVLDLFGGSGSTLVACEHSGRRCLTMEIDSRYCDVIVRRWQELTGEEAHLEANGRSFADLAAACLAQEA